MMKRATAVQIAALIAIGSLVTACQDTLIYGESTAFDLSIHVNDSPQSPVEVNAGLKRYAAETAPPVLTAKDENGKDKAAGEAVSSFSGFALTYDREGIFGDLFIRTQFASGLAATALAGDPAEAAKVVQADFDRPDSFVAGEVQTRVDKILDGIIALPDDKALTLACNPPVRHSKMADQIVQGDPNCKRRTDPAAARQILKMQAVLDDRTEDNLNAWEEELGIQ